MCQALVLTVCLRTRGYWIQIGDTFAYLRNGGGVAETCVNPTDMNADGTFTVAYLSLIHI
eukprot:5208964-Pyramimonas_sp.AAC.1